MKHQLEYPELPHPPGSCSDCDYYRTFVAVQERSAEFKSAQEARRIADAAAAVMRP